MKTSRSEYFRSYNSKNQPDKLNFSWVCPICQLFGKITRIKTKSGKRKHLKSEKHINNNIKNIDLN